MLAMTRIEKASSAVSPPERVVQKSPPASSRGEGSVLQIDAGIYIK